VGAGAIGGEAVRAGEVWLLPEQGDQPVISPKFRKTNVKSFVLCGYMPTVVM
jgi:hypothetical protein